MFDSSIGRPQADVELADVVCRFGPQYTAQHGQTMTERTGQALHDAEGEDVNTPRYAPPSAAKRFVQETFRIGFAMRKVLSVWCPNRAAVESR